MTTLQELEKRRAVYYMPGKDGGSIATIAFGYQPKTFSSDHDRQHEMACCTAAEIVRSRRKGDLFQPTRCRPWEGPFRGTDAKAISWR